MAATFRGLRSRYFLLPIFSLIPLIYAWPRSLSSIVMVALGLLLVAAVFVAVHHAEVVALRVGEPFGSLILALSVTIIEVGMILVLVIGAPEKNVNLARDTVFAALMITMNGIVGIALLVKTLSRGIATFNALGVSGALSALAAVSTLSLVLPTVTTSSPGPTRSPPASPWPAARSI